MNNADAPMTKDDFIKNLIERNSFELLTPHLLRYEDGVDIITVALRPGVVIIPGDGPSVVPNWNMIQVREGPDTYFWESTYQQVLAKF